jgi:hypothetical protein
MSNILLFLEFTILVVFLTILDIVFFNYYYSYYEILLFSFMIVFFSYIKQKIYRKDTLIFMIKTNNKEDIIKNNNKVVDYDPFDNNFQNYSLKDYEMLNFRHHKHH